MVRWEHMQASALKLALFPGHAHTERPGHTHMERLSVWAWPGNEVTFLFPHIRGSVHLIIFMTALGIYIKKIPLIPPLDW